MTTPDTESSSAALDDDGVWPSSFEEDDEMTWLHREGDEASKTLLPLVDETATKLVWASSDVALPYLAPWEALMIALLFDGPASAGTKTRRDVAIAVHVARILQIPHALQYQNPVVAAGPRGWIYRQVYIQSLSIGEDLDVLDYHQRSRRPSRFTTAIHGVLPPKKALDVKWCQALVDAIKGNHTDIFVLAATYCVASGSLLRNSVSAAGKAMLLKFILKDRHHQLFLSVLPPHFLIDHNEGLEALLAVARYPALFQQAVDQLTAAGVDLAPEAGRLLQGLPAAQKWSIGETLINLYRPSSETEFFAVFESLLSDSHMRVNSFITSVAKHRFVSTHHERWGDVLEQVLCLHPQQSSRIMDEKVRTLVDQCPALGFDLELATRNLIERRSVRGCLEGINMPCFRYVFLDSLGMDRVRRLLTPLELLQWLRSDRYLQLMVENGFELPEPKSPECAELAKAVMLLFKESGSKFFVYAAAVLRVIQVDLNKEALAECLTILCEGLSPTVCSYDYEGRARCALQCLQYFAAKGSLTSDFRFPNGDGLQHRIGFGSGGFCSSGDTVALELIRYLQVDLNLDFTEVNPATGEFPLSLALERGDAISVVQLLKQKLLPPKDVLLGYRQGSQTLLSMLFFLPREKLGRKPQLGREFCESVGVEVVRELAKVKVKVRIRRAEVGGEGMDVVSVLPLEIACENWPLEELVYLIDKLKLEGSDSEKCKAVKARFNAR
jgi:hypothetical protein